MLRLTAIALVLFVTALTGPALADERVDQLDTADFETRQLATRQLMTDDSLTVDAVIELYKRARSPEQRHRLATVAEHLMLWKQRLENFPLRGKASIGVVPMGVPVEQLPEVGKPAVAVLSLSPGFPGFVYLRQGDLITEVNGQSLREGLPSLALSQEFGNLVRATPAGRDVTLSVWRDGQLLTFKFPTASFASLEAMYQNGRTLEVLYQARVDALRARLAAATPPTPAWSVDLPATEEPSARQEKIPQQLRIQMQIRPEQIILE